MSKSAIVAVAAVIAVALGIFFYNSSKPPSGVPGGSPGPCAGSNPHCIVVTVSGGAIAPIPDHEVHDHSVDIDWVIATPGYTFPANGITFTGKPGMPLPDPNEFSCSLFNTTTFKCKDKNHTQGKFGYTVTLSGSPAVPPLDPLIINH